MAFAVFQGFLESRLQSGEVIGVDHVEEGVGDEVGDAATDELLQWRGGGDPVEVGRQTRDHTTPRAAAQKTHRAE